MSIEQRFHDEMLDIYQRAGKEIGYWGKRYLQSVRNKGGLAAAKSMLGPGTRGKVYKGLQVLIDSGRPNLSVEALVLKPQFKTLFTADELREAQRRLDEYVPRRVVPPEDNFPETLPDRGPYSEGAVRRVSVNAHERNRRAREVCIKKHGVRCAVCRINFEETYGDIGKGFIHVHHKMPVSMRRRGYRLDPGKNLVPVCPNCHAMLHVINPPYSIKELRSRVKRKD